MYNVKINAREKDLPKNLKKDYKKFKRLAENKSQQENMAYYVVFYKSINNHFILNIWNKEFILEAMEFNVIKVLYNGRR
jgi:hypothetical protein